jgi:hypothetical protein
VGPGEAVTFTATFHNGTTAATEYQVPWCGGAAAVVMSVGLPLEPEGKSWTGIAGVFKDYALEEGFGAGGVPAMAPVNVQLPANPCNDGQFEAILEPGDSVVSSMSWPAEIVAGVPALADRVPFTVSVDYDREDDQPTPSANTTGPRGMVIRRYKQLVVNGSVEVVGNGPHVVTPGEAIDALLGNAKFASWLTAQPRETWSVANLFLISSAKAEGIVPAGPSWDIELFPDTNARHWAIGFVDPFDASVRSVTYCNVPCDR